MEESSEAHMETDVSSTTEDIPESNETTGSHNNMEMVIVVEELKDEDDFYDDNGKEETVSEVTNTEILVQSPENLVESDISVSKSYEKESESPKSIQKLASTPELPQKTVNKESQPSKSTTPSPQNQQVKTIDSSSKIEVSSPKTAKEEKTIKENLVQAKEIQTDPEKVILVKDNKLSTPLKSPVKESSVSVPEQKNDDNIRQTSEPNQEDIEGKTKNIVLPIDITIERDVDIIDNGNECQSESITEEKEQNKSLSRELKSLINSAKESKIISECTQITSKIRKSRTPLDNTSLNISESEKIQGIRRHSNNSQKSSCSEKSEKVALKRSMRSQNPEFVSKSPIKNGKLQLDLYCWRCHWDVEQVSEKSHTPLHCTVCPRTYHYKCLSGNERNRVNAEKSWLCPECMAILNAESSETRSPGMKKISLGRLCELLNFALERMMDLNGVEPFMNPVDRNAFPDYDKYVVHPMDLSLMKSNIEASLYGSTEAFLADANWILHNSIIFNTRMLLCLAVQSKLTGAARALVRSCRAEMGEIETCPECYAAAHARKPTWFTDVCSTPHILLWAKLKGFPYWPAKGMSVNNNGLVDVRFFGAHDRAWVPHKDCFLYSERDPNNFRTKRQDILDSMQEAEQHIRNISRKYGKFVYPPFKTQLEPSKLTEKSIKEPIVKQYFLLQMCALYSFRPTGPSGSSGQSGPNWPSGPIAANDVSESEDQSGAVTKLKATESNDETKADNDQSTTEKDKTMEIDETPQKKANECRKRRHSGVDETVFTVVEIGSTEKRKKVVYDKKTDIKTLETQERICSIEGTPKEKEVELSNKEDKNMEVHSNEDKVGGIDLTQDEEPSSSTTDKAKTPKMTPIKIIFSNKDSSITIKSPKPSTPKSSTPNEKSAKPIRIEKAFVNDKEAKNDKTKSQRRQSSKSNKSLNNSTTNKSDKPTDKKAGDLATANNKKNNIAVKNKDSNTNKSVNDKTLASNKTSKNVTQSDDDTSLAIIARTNSKSAIVGGDDISRLPTISHVMSLSTLAQCTYTTTSKTTASSKTLELTIEAHPNSSIFTPTSTDNVKTAKDAQTKLQKLRNETEPVVGRVGVRSFARMKSPEPKSRNDNLQSEIKCEPIEIDDADRHMEKMDLMKSFELRPVNLGTQNLREVRINKMVVTPVTVNKAEPRPKAKKSFPQPRKPDEGRSELNGNKNSMVYIPIQPSNTQPPIRPTKPAVNGPVSNASKTITSANTTLVTSLVNTQTTSILPVAMTSLLSTSTTSTMVSSSFTSSGQTPTIGQVPTTVHTVPLMTSVNGQWMLSLQPVMSVGGVDSTPSPPIVNGIVERTNLAPGLVPLSANASAPTGGTVVTANIITPPSTNSTTNKPSENTPGEPPRLQQRPPLMNPFDASATFPTTVPPPSSVGPLTAKLNQNANKLTDFFRNLIEDTLEKLDEPSTAITSLRLQLEQAKWRYQMEINELKHNHELTVAEMRATFEKELTRAVNDVRRVAQLEQDVVVQQTKSKQWCANCNQEAQFYCCWNTSYCDYPCQKAHWSQHFSNCAQQWRQDGSNDDSMSLESRLQPQPDKLPKKAPALTVGGKAASRGFAADQSLSQVHKKPAIIVSMMEDSNGNQSMKCVGTYKPQPQQSMLINKQIMSKEESNKKVVTSGGYLIVGAGAPNSSTVVTPSRRTHTTVQYIQTS
ncbi:hypothetical protein K1T71_003414 [Dendrolimus kikuchii]|uniref:Uncharacterized protein n=1 Tax=Dendrolimus kikuchii TaxID=765133 RepID=A0ACC1DC78_9NEOP|nr:hypothetical protein K1T71_003414 [Dendrolimus kikuchii]